MNKSFFPIIGAAIAIVSAAAGRLEAAPTPTCSQNAPLDTECLHVIFHNQSMELVEVGYRNHKETKTRIPLYEYTTTGHITVTPYYGGLEKGQSSSIKLFEEGEATIRFTTNPPNTDGPFSVKAEGVFTQSFKDTPLKLVIPWKCSAKERSLDLPKGTQKPLEVEIKTTVNFSTGGCSLKKGGYLCPCDYEISQKPGS